MQIKNGLVSGVLRVLGKLKAKSIEADEITGSLTGNASGLKDSNNGATMTSAYSKAGLDTTSWFAAWNGQELRAISPSKTRTTIGAAASDHTHSYAGSSSAGGSATSAVKLDTATAGDANTPVYFSGGKPVACTSLDLNTSGSSASCTGNAATATTATKLGTATKSSATQPIYLNAGVPTACTYTLGKSVPSDAKFTDTNTWTALKGSTTSAAGTAGYIPAPAAGAANRYLRCDGTWTVPPDTNTTYSLSSFGITATAAELNYVDGVTSNIQTQLNGKAASSHTHKYASSSSAGGSATSAVKLDTATAGSATQPVYFSSGKPVACTYTLGKSVPSNAVFTDTNTWNALKGSTTSAAGTAGYAPAPAAGAANRYLRCDGTWAVPPDNNTTYTLSSFGITATAAELNKLDGITATVTELNYTDGVTSNIQTQLNAKQATITGGATTIATSNLTASRALVSNSSGKVAVSAVTSTELGYLDGVTSAIQTQLNAKQKTITYGTAAPSGGSNGDIYIQIV